MLLSPQMTEERQVCSPPPLQSKLPRLAGTETDPDEGAVSGGHGGAAGSRTAGRPAGQGLGTGGVANNSGETPGTEASAATRPASALTFMQRQELDHQALIYRYLAAGAAVPAHLVIPIWKSVSAASSSGPKNIPWLKRLGSPSIDYRGGVEPEPGRCQRTDGKKWRCSRDVVPGHKYCERQVHRGRGCSRKPVEASASAAAAPAIPTAIPVHAAAATGDANAPSPTRLGFSSTGVLLPAAPPAPLDSCFL